MRIMLIDDERPALGMLSDTLRDIVDEDTEIVPFNSTGEFFSYKGDRHFDVAFVDIELGGQMNGIQFAFEIKDIAPKCNIIFVTSYDEYGTQAHTTRPSGYLLKPYEAEDIKNELENLRYPVQRPHPEKTLRVVTFGNFVVYKDDDEIFEFSRTKSKEVFAYLIDCAGYPVTTKEIARDVLEEDLDTQVSKRLSKIILAMIDDLSNAGYRDIIIRQNRQIMINRGRISCDLFDALHGETDAINAYQGDYMIDYSWAELSSTIKELKDRK